VHFLLGNPVMLTSDCAIPEAIMQWAVRHYQAIILYHIWIWSCQQTHKQITLSLPTQHSMTGMG